MADVNIRVTAEGANEVANIFKGLGQSIEGMGGTLKRVFETAAGVQLATSFQQLAVQAAAFAKELVTLGLEAERQNDAFERMTKSLGVNSTALATAMETASRGIADASDLMATSIRGLQEGLQPEQLVKIVEIATEYSKIMGTTVPEAVEKFTMAVIRSSDKLLVGSAISIDAAAANEKYAASMGKSVEQLTDAGKSHAFYLALVEKTAPAVAAMSQEQLTNSQATEKAASAWKNFKEQLGVGIVDTLGSIVIGIKQATAAANEWSAQASTKYVEFGNTLAGLRDKAVAWGASMMGIAPALATTSTETVKLGEAAMEASRGTSASARGLADMGTNAAASAPHFKTTAGELKKIADEADKVAGALAKAQAQFAAMNMTEEEKKAQSVADAFEEMAKSVEKLGPAGAAAAKEIRALGIEAGKIVDATQAWEDYDKILGDIDDALKDLHPPLRTTTELTKGLGLSLNAVDFDAFVDGLSNAGEALRDGIVALKQWPSELQLLALALDDLDLAILRDDVRGLVTEFTNITPAMERLGQSAEDAALEMALLSDSMEPLLKLAEDERWADIGRGLEGAFLSITDAFTKVVDGVIAGTTDIDTAFQNLGQSLLLNFVQYAQHEIWDPFLKDVAGVATEILRSLSTGDWAKIGDQIKGIFAPFDPNAPGSGAPGMGPWQPSNGLEMFSINNLLTAQTALAGILVLMQGIALLAEGETGQGLGTLIGGGIGLAAGLYLSGGNPIGGAVGATAGSAVGGLLGGLLEPDYAAIRESRRLQRSRTGQAVVGDAAREFFRADDLGELAQQFRKGLAGTSATIGGVILNMVENNLSDLDITGKDAQRIETFLRGQGFGVEQFSQGRVGSVKELLATAGPEWDALLKGISSFLEVMEDVYTTVTKLEGKSLDEFTGDFEDFFEVLDVARMLEQLGFEEGAGKLRDRLRAMILGFEDSAAVIDKLTAAAVKLVRADPTQLVRFLDMKEFQKAGEDIEQTTNRMTASLRNLGAFMRTAQQEIDAIKGIGPNVVADIRSAQKDIDIRLQKIGEEAAKLTDPSEIFPLAQEAYALTKERYMLEIEAAQALVAIIDSAASQLASTAGVIASNADWLAEAGIGFTSMGVSLANLVTMIPTAAGKLDLLSGAITLFGVAVAKGEFNKPFTPTGAEILPPGFTYTGFNEAMSNAMAPILQGFVDSFIHIMNIQDPNQRQAGLTGLLDNIGKFLATLPEDQRKALIAAFGPEVQLLIDAIIKTGEEQAKAALAAADQLKQLMKDSGALNVENFIVMTIDKMADALQLIVTHAGQALEDAVTRALDKFLPRAQHGVAYVPTTRPYVLHEGERVLTKAENVAYAQGAASHGGGGGGTTVTLSFGAIHLARGGRQEAEEFIATVEASIKHGRLRNAVQRAAVGQA